MRLVSTRLHGAVDYLWGLALLLAPRLFHLRPGSAEARTAQAAGAGAIAYAALTDYELGLVPVLSMRQHLALDIAGGAALAAAPALLGFSHRRGTPHMAFGLFAIGAGLLTRTRPGHGPRTLAPAHPRGSRKASGSARAQSPAIAQKPWPPQAA
ncbi:SPW repeat domain-containing protein [Dankookia sp. P2]|uniref:SPW repeat domain-containing protein n=1 Tax=Dankookia sp. P2 TaxID=3423955 RepID=UPI003D66DF21